MQEDFGQILERRLQQGKLDLPVFPESAREVLAATEREDCDARMLSEIVRRDPTLAAHFLRVANTPAFGITVPIVSLPQALARIGMVQARQIALLVTCQARAFACKARWSAARALRRRAVATAMWAQEIARLRRLNVEEAFLCGLLEDIGVPTLWQLASDIDDQSGETSDAVAVDRVIGSVHPHVGAEIIRSWGFSERLAEAIARHQDPLSDSLVGGASVDMTIAAVQLAELLAELTTQDASFDPEMVKAHPSVVPLSLYDEDFQTLWRRTDAVRQTMAVLG